MCLSSHEKIFAANHDHDDETGRGRITKLAKGRTIKPPTNNQICILSMSDTNEEANDATAAEDEHQVEGGRSRIPPKFVNKPFPVRPSSFS